MNDRSFGTATTSPLYRLETNKKDLSTKEKSLVVTLSYPIYKEITDEMVRWHAVIRAVSKVSIP